MLDSYKIPISVSVLRSFLKMYIPCSDISTLLYRLIDKLSLTNHNKFMEKRTYNGVKTSLPISP